MHEDTQPNETRPSRKGNANVPVIRTTTRPRGASRGFRGRGEADHSFQRGLIRPAYAPQSHSSFPDPSFSTAPRGAYHNTNFGPPPRPYGGWHRGANHNKHQSTGSHVLHRNVNYPASTPFPDYPARFSSPQFQTSGPVLSPPERPYKIPRLAYDNHIHYPEAGPSIKNWDHGKRPAKVQRQVMFVNLPEDCRKGAHNMKQFRTRWVREQLPRIAEERGVDVVAHAWLDDQIRLEYLPKAVLEAGSLEPRTIAAVDYSSRHITSQKDAYSNESEDRVRSQTFQPRLDPGHPVKTTIQPSRLYLESHTSNNSDHGRILADRSGAGPLIRETITTPQLALPTNAPVDVEIIDLTIADEESTVAHDESQDGQAVSTPPQQGVATNSPDEQPPVAIVETINPSTQEYAYYRSTRRQLISPSRPRLPPTSLVNLTDERAISEGLTSAQTHSNEEDDSGTGTSERQNSVRWEEIGHETLRMTREAHDKPRRLLTTVNDGLFVITRRGAALRMSWDAPRTQRSIYSPGEHSKDTVEDACVGYNDSGQAFLLMAEARDRGQLSMLPISGTNQPVSPPLSFDRPAEKTDKAKKSGITAICSMMQSGMFATGGYDHRVHLWTIPDDPVKTSMRQLPVKHTALVQSLLPVRDTSHKLVTAGADCKVNIWELASERVVNTFKVSNSVYHIHRTDLPYGLLLEVAHRELQFEIRDYRLVPEKPVQRFGFNIDNFQGRYARGDVSQYTFVCGDREGNLRIWDIRKPLREVAVISCFPGQRAMDVAFRGDKVVACSDDFRVKILRPVESN